MKIDTKITVAVLLLYLRLWYYTTIRSRFKMSVNSITATLTPSVVSVKSGNLFSLEFDLTNTNVKQDPIIFTAKASYTDETGASREADAVSTQVTVDRSVLTNVVTLPLPAGIAYVVGSAQWNGAVLATDATVVDGVLTAIVNESLLEQGVGKFTASFTL